MIVVSTIEDKNGSLRTTWLVVCLGRDGFRVDECNSFRFGPYFGMVTIIMNDYPALKWAVIGAMVLMSRNE